MASGRGFSSFLLSVCLLQLAVQVLSYSQYSFSPPSGRPRSAEPSGFTTFNGQLFFTANDEVHGNEIWKTDGTVAGTDLVRDLQLGTGSSSPNNYGVAGGKLYFQAYDVYDSFLWVSDGTSENSRRVTDSNGGYGMYIVNDNVVFGRYTQQYGFELWYVDKATETAHILVDIWPGPDTSSASFRASNGTHAIFLVNQPVSGQAFWITDGTPAGTKFLHDLSAANNYGQDVVFASGTDFVLTFREYDDHGVPLPTKFYKTDGVDVTYLFSKDITIGTPVLTIGSISIFQGFTFQEGTEIFKTDLTEEGTAVIKESIVGDQSLYSSLMPYSINGKALIWYSDYSLWATDGTEAGTVVLLSGMNSQTIFLGILGNDMYLGSNGYTPSDLIKTDGTPSGTHILRSDLGYGYGTSGGTLGSQLFFSCTESIDSGTQLCVTDGTTQGTQVFKVINQINLGNPSSMVPVTNDLAAYVYGPDSKIWLANGDSPSHTVTDDSVYTIGAGKGPLTGKIFYSTSGTVKYYDLNTNSATVLLPSKSLSPIGSTETSGIFFLAEAFRYGSYLWSTDGTPGGTQNLGVTGSSPGILWKNDYLFTNSSESERYLRKTTGVPGSSVILADINSSLMGVYVTTGIPSKTLDSLFVVVYVYGYGLEIWKTDGTPAGTSKVGGIPQPLPGQQTLQYLTGSEVPGVGIFIVVREVGSDSGVASLWKISYPDANSLTVVKTGWTDVKTAQSGGSEDLFVFTLFQTSKSEMWSSDGTEEGTAVFLSSETEGEELAFASKKYISSPDGRVFFVATTAATGEQLWSTKGTHSTTQLIPNPTLPLGAPTGPDYLVLYKNSLFFLGFTSQNTIEIYREELVDSGDIEILKEIHNKETGWLPGGEIFRWGQGTCVTKSQQVPESLPIPGTTSDDKVDGLALKLMGDGVGCGSFYYSASSDSLLSLEGGSSLRFWLRSSVRVKIEVQVGERPGIPGRKIAMEVDSTERSWSKLEFSLEQLSPAEKEVVYGPFLITLLGDGFAVVSDIILV